jgi:UDP-N-acetylglucosamine transferase subunit ALG13
VILVTVGTQGPFDRLVQTVDAWAGEVGGQEIFAQIGPSDFRPQHLQFAESMDPARFERMLKDADIVISHAGMGTILKALELGKPVLIMPRRASLGEQRNEHQLATAERFKKMGVVRVAADEVELRRELDQLQNLAASEQISSSASPQLIHRLRGFLLEHLGEPE